MTARLAAGFQLKGAHLLIGLLALALIVRLIGLGVRPFWLDEGYSLYAIERTWHDLWTIVPTYETHPPFYYSLLKGWSSLVGTSAIAVRGFSVLLSVATIPLVIAAVRELEAQDPTGRPTLHAAVSGFLASCSPMLIYLDQQARPYALMVLAYSVATLGLLRLFREFRSGGPGSLLSWSLLCGGTELTLWSHSLGLLYAFCLAAALAPAWLEHPLHSGRIKRGMIAAAAVLLLYLPCLLIIASQVGDWGTSWLKWEPFKLLELIAFYSIPVEALNVVTAVAALIMLLLIKRAVQRAAFQPSWTSGRALVLLWWGPTLLAVLISVTYVPVFLPRTLAATLAPAYLAIGGAAARIDSRRERLLLTAALAITLLPAAVLTAIQPASEKWDQIGAYLERNVAPADEVWLYPNDSVLPLRQLAPKPSFRIREIPDVFPAVAFKGINRSGSPSTPSLTPRQAQQLADSSAAQRVGTVWLVTRQSDVFDPHDDLPHALIRTRRAGKVRHWGYIVVQPFRLNNAAN